MVNSSSYELGQYFPPDDWHRQIQYRSNAVFICPSTRSVYSYDFNPQVYGVVLRKLESPDQTVMEFERGFLTGLPPGPHHGAYSITRCDGSGAVARPNGEVVPTYY
jgi:hypothetical protein